MQAFSRATERMLVDGIMVRAARRVSDQLGAVSNGAEILILRSDDASAVICAVDAFENIVGDLGEASDKSDDITVAISRSGCGCRAAP
jgi:hypothetical protein